MYIYIIFGFVYTYILNCAQQLRKTEKHIYIPTYLPYPSFYTYTIAHSSVRPHSSQISVKAKYIHTYTMEVKESGISMKKERRFSTTRDKMRQRTSSKHNKMSLLKLKPTTSGSRVVRLNCIFSYT